MKFNETTKGTSKTVNHEGSVAYKETPEMELYSLVCTSFLEDKFYTGSNDQIDRIRKLIAKVSPEFVVKLAIYAREKMYLRSVPLVLMIELAKVHNGDQLVSKGLTRVIQRADEICEALSYYQLANERTGDKKLNKLSNQVKKAIGDSFYKFDEYQFGKYNRNTSVTLRDALFLSHPSALTENQGILFKKIVEDTLDVPYTWETQLSESGKNGKEKKQVWEELIDSNKLGYMALLRNLRNILESKVSLEHIKKVAIVLSDKEQVIRSKQLPFRFLSAYKELRSNDSLYTSTILTAVEEAVVHSASNIKGYDYNTSVLIASDVSGSMECPISPKSKLQNYDIGLLLSMMLQTKCKSSITGIFGDRFSVEQMPKSNILQNVIDLHGIEGKVGYSTNGYKVLEYLIQNKINVDKVIMFTDCQMWDSDSYYSGDSNMPQRWLEYKKLNPSAKLYLFDLAGHGNTPLQINENDVYLISGFSEKIFDALDSLDKGNSVLDEVNKITL